MEVERSLRLLVFHLLVASSLDEVGRQDLGEASSLVSSPYLEVSSFLAFLLEGHPSLVVALVSFLEVEVL